MDSYSKISDSARDSLVDKFEVGTLAKLIANQRHPNSSNPFMPQLTINLQYTQYEVLRDVSEALNMHNSFNEIEDPEWDIYWMDGPIIPSFLLKM